MKYEKKYREIAKKYRVKKEIMDLLNICISPLAYKHKI